MEHTYFEPEQQRTSEHMTDEKRYEQVSDKDTDIWEEEKRYHIWLQNPSNVLAERDPVHLFIRALYSDVDNNWRTLSSKERRKTMYRVLVDVETSSGERFTFSQGENHDSWVWWRTI